MRHFHLTLLIAACLCVCWFVSPCSWGGTPDPVRIGATLSLTGKYAEPSGMVRNGYRLWQKQVNARGGLLGRPVQLIFYDDRSSPELAARFYEKLITDDKVDLVLSPYSTPLTAAAAEVTTRHGYTMLAAGAGGEEVWSGRYRNVFGVYGPGKRYFVGFLDIMASNGLNTVAIVYENSSFHRDVAAGAVEWAGRFGLKVVLCVPYDSGQKELPDILKQVMKAKPDGLIFSSYPKDSYLMLDLMQKAKYRPKALGLPIASTYPDFYKEAGPIAEGIFGASQWEPDERIPFPGTRKFIADFTAFAKTAPSYHAGSAYAACQILENAINHCRCLDQFMIADFIRSLDSVTITGRFKVDQDGKQTGHNTIIIQWQNGRKEIVFPANMRTAPPRL